MNCPVLRDAVSQLGDGSGLRCIHKVIQSDIKAHAIDEC
jgi:hypothetical protein